MTSNYKVNRSVINFIHARDYFPEKEAEECRYAVQNLKFEPMAYGTEIRNFNLVPPETNMLMGAMIGENFVKVEDEGSGTFRYPYDGLIHFEEFDTLEEWRLSIALEDNVFRTYSHLSGFKTVLDCKNEEWKQLVYHNQDEWVLESTVNLRTNDAIFYRPWVFHSFEGKLLHCHNIKGEQ